MGATLARSLGVCVTMATIAAVVALLNVAPANTAQAACEPGSGNEQSNSPSGNTTPSPSESDDDPLPLPSVTLPGQGEDTPTPTQSSSQPPGDSENQSCPTRLSIAADRSRASSSTVTFKGNVRSPESACENGRNVSLRKKRQGPDRTVGSTISRRNGAWSIREPRPKGRYYAVAPRRSVDATSCETGMSRTIRV